MEAERENSSQAGVCSTELELLYQQAPIGLCLIDRQLRFASCNQVLAEIDGCSIEEHLGKTVRQIVPDLADELEPMFEHIFATGKSVLELEVFGSTPADPGQLKYWLGCFYPLKDSVGNVQHISVIAKDVTEQKRAKENLEKSEARYRALFENSPDAIFMHDAETGIILDCNQKAEEMFGRTREEMTGLTPVDISAPFTPDGKPSGPWLQKQYERILSGQIDTFEWFYLNADRKSTPCEIRTILFPHEGRHIFRASVSDISKRKQAEEAAGKAFKEVQQLKERLEEENLSLRTELKDECRRFNIVGNSKEIKHVLQQAERVADAKSTVLILGETGTGKERVAGAIHEMSPRHKRPMITVNCAALPSTLIENELFGREKGAYTGALSSQMGRFEVAHKSTLFLDEISELTPELQVKLLRVLEQGQFERLGSTKTLTVDVRIIAATNRDLSREVEKGNFREDLYYRLNVFPIPIPPLRERSGDIPLLVWAFVKEFCEQMGRRVDTISRKSMEQLQQYPWPGNVRELRNVVEHAIILNQGPKLTINPPENRGQLQSLGNTIADVERSHIKKILDQAGGRVRGQNGAAKILGLKPTTLEYRMKKLEIKSGS